MQTMVLAEIRIFKLIVEDLQPKPRFLSLLEKICQHSLRSVIINLINNYMALDQDHQRCLLLGKLMALEEIVIFIKILEDLLSLMITQNFQEEEINIYKIFVHIKNQIEYYLKILRNFPDHQLKSQNKIFLLIIKNRKQINQLRIFKKLFSLK